MFDFFRFFRFFQEKIIRKNRFCRNSGVKEDYPPEQKKVPHLRILTPLKKGIAIYIYLYMKTVILKSDSGAENHCEGFMSAKDIRATPGPAN